MSTAMPVMVERSVLSTDIYLLINTQTYVNSSAFCLEYDSNLSMLQLVGIVIYLHTCIMIRLDTDFR